MTPQQKAIYTSIAGSNPTKAMELLATWGNQYRTAQASVTKPISHAQMEAIGYTPDPSKNYQIKNGKISPIGGAGITINQGTLTTKVDHLGRTYTTDNKSGTTTAAIDPETGEQILSSTANPGSFEAASYRFSERMNASSDKLEALEMSAASEDPFVGKDEAFVGKIFGDTAQRMYMSPTQQIYAQAVRDWMTANLRQESGAAIPEEEVAREFEKYFVLPGESDPRVIANKRQARALATGTMNDLGNVAREFYAHRKGRANIATPSQQKLPTAKKGSGWRDNPDLIKRR